MLENIANKFGKKYLFRELSKEPERKASVVDFSKANSLALLSDLSSENDYHKLVKLENYFKSEFGIKNVFALGFVNDKKDPDFMKSSLSFDFISRKDLNWKGIPSGVVFESFLEKKFDIIIDLTIESSISLKYTLLKANAKCKVGRFSKENTALYDLMIDVKSEDFEEFVNQVVFYLNMIKPK